MREPQSLTDAERDYYALNLRVFTALAPFYDAVTWPLARLRREVVSAAGAAPDSRVLDVATGTGAQAFAFAEVAAEVVGIDLSDAMLRVARKHNRSPNVAFLQADATELPFEDARFDITCISFALHEMPARVRERTAREMARVTRPGGTVVVVDYALPHGLLLRPLAYHLVKLYERGSYADFVRSDLPLLLRGADVEVREDRAVLLGMARLVTATVPIGALRKGPVIGWNTP